MNLKNILNNVLITKIEENIVGVYDVVFEYLGAEIAMISVKNEHVRFWKQERDDLAKEYWKFSYDYDNDNNMLLNYELVNEFKKLAVEELVRRNLRK